MPEVQIGVGAIVAAQSVVTKSVEPYTVVGGNPVRAIRQRFDEATLQTLLELQWWHWDITKIPATSAPSAVRTLSNYDKPYSKPHNFYENYDFDGRLTGRCAALSRPWGRS